MDAVDTVLERCVQAVQVRALLMRLAHDDLDAAIDAGLMTFSPCPGPCPCRVQAAPLLAAQQRLRQAWEARTRYRARQTRLAQRAALREARRIPSTQASGATPGTAPSALPVAAADILARAKARAAGHTPE